MKAVFENEEAARLLNYFVFYKEICSKNEIVELPSNLALEKQFLNQT